MTSFPWLQPICNQLVGYIEQKRLPHALLITGIPGVGKRQLAESFAQRLLCGSPVANGSACNQCPSCLLYLGHTHPDYCVAEPAETGKILPIDAIRKVINILALTPQYSGHRVVILSSAHNMSMGAANSLLKTLEEPPDRSLIILITEAPELLSATIVSRCQRFHINTPVHQQGYTWLETKTKNSDCNSLLALAQGAPLKALDLAKTKHLQLRNESYQQWRSIGQFNADPITIAEKWSKLPEDSILSWMMTWVVDMIRLHFHPGFENLFNVDLRNSLQADANRLNLKQVFEYWEILLLAKKQYSTQINKLLLLEELLVKWCEMHRHI